MQLYWVLHHGTYLAHRWDDESAVNLYHCAGDGRGFFVEVGINDGRGQAVVMRSFVDSGGLCVRGAIAMGMKTPRPDRPGRFFALYARAPLYS